MRWQTIFGDAYAQVQQLYANLQVNTTYKGRLDRDDLAMMDNMNFVLRQYPDDKFFGQLSNGHVTQSAWKDGQLYCQLQPFRHAAERRRLPRAGRSLLHADDLYPARQQRPAGR